MTTGEKKSRQMPKGGRKGGTSFPRVSLNDALGYAKKLVAKTHVAPQPEDVIHSGVVGAKGGAGAVKVSSLKQYGLLSGDKASKFKATELAKKISAAPPEDLIALYRRAALQPSVFKALFATYHGDAVTKGRLRQRAADLKVHPEETDSCVDLYVSAMTVAQLITIDGDKVTHIADIETVAAQSAAAPIDASTEEGESNVRQAENEAGTSDEEASESTAPESVVSGSPGRPNPAGATSGPRAVFNVNVTLDSSLDIEKLQKQLELLKRFGAI